MCTRRGWGRPAWRGPALGLVLCLSMQSLGLAGTGAAAATAAASASAGAWTVYHGDPTGSGEAASTITSVSTAAPAWTSPAFDGQLYGEPLISGGTVFAATENDTVYALSAASGAVVWSTHLAPPVPASSLPCGDISPSVGITGTPVLDPVKGELFVVADEDSNGTPAHVLVGLQAATGKVVLSDRVDPPGSTPADLLQRTGLTLDAGRVIFGFGGNYGDCGHYKGWVVSVPESGGPPDDFAVDAGAGENQGAIWMGGAAPTVDASGNVWVSAGNGSVTSASQAYDDSDSVLELTPTMSLMQYFAPTQWPSDNASDKDFSTSPALLADGKVLIAGKSRIAYLLNGTHLGGIGGQQATLPDACSDVIDGGMAVVGTTVFLPCESGVVALQVAAAPASVQLRWRSSAGAGPPIVAGGLVWSISQAGVLSGLDPATGAVVHQVSIGSVANHFPTPSAAGGLLLAPASDRVVAFTATSASTPSTTTSTTAAPTTSTSRAASGRAPHGQSNGWRGGALALIVIAAVVVVGGTVTAVLARRRRRRAGPP